MKLILVGVGLFLFYFLVSIPYYSGDIKNHLAWAKNIDSQGLYGFYEREIKDIAFPNYPPLSMLMFYLSWKLYQLTLLVVTLLNSYLGIFPSNLIYFFKWENVEIAFLKMPAILATLMIAWCIYLLNKAFFKKSKKYLLLTLSFFLFNPATIYLTSVWGQIDLLPSSFLLFAIFFLFKSNIYLSLILGSLSLLTKQTVIIFWIVYAILVLKKFGIKYISLGIIFSIVIFYVFYLPFHTFSLTWPFELYMKNFSLVAFSTGENAINFWGYLSNFARQSDLNKFLFLTYQQWGYILFGLQLVVVLFLFYFSKFTYKRLFFSLGIITISYFFFLTRMHERYLIPAVAFFGILALLEKRFLISLIIFSSINFINLYRGLFQPDIIILKTLTNSIFFLKILFWTYLFLLIYNYYVFIKDFKNEK